MVRIQPFSSMRNLSPSPKHLSTDFRLNSKKARQLRLLLEAGKVKFVKSPSPLSERGGLQSLQRFSQFASPTHFPKSAMPISIQVVGKSSKFKGAEYVSPLFSLGGVLLRRARLRKSLLYRTRFYKALLSNSNRVKHLGKSLLQARLLRLKHKLRRKNVQRLNELVLLPVMSDNTSPKSRRSGSSGPIKSHIQRYVTRTYSNLPKTLSYALRRSSAPLYGSFANSSRQVLTRQSLAVSNWIFLWSRLTFLYISFSLLPCVELYLRRWKAQKRVVRHHLRFRFNRQRLMLTLADEPTRSTHMFISPGLFLKYFQRKKSLKKNKSMKFLMVRFMRKVLLVLRIKNVVINSRGVPVHLNSLLSVLFRPFSHHFEDPLTSTVINETEGQRNINVSAIMFTSPRPFGFQKTRKMGRVKRKIRRRITRLGNVID